MATDRFDIQEKETVNLLTEAVVMTASPLSMSRSV